MAKDSKLFEGSVYFMTLTVVGWTDVFIRNDYRELIASNLRFCIDNKRLEVYAFCLMTNHLHFIVGCLDGDLGKVIRDYKSFTGKVLLDAMEQNPRESRKDWLKDRFAFLGRTLAKDTKRQFWDLENYPEEIRTEALCLQKQHYMPENPARSVYFVLPEDWMYSSARPVCTMPIVRY